MLKDDKSYKKILIYDIWYKTLIGSKPLRNRLNEIDGIVRIYDGTRYFTLFNIGTKNLTLLLII